MKGKRHFCIVPCVLWNEVAPITAQPEYQGPSTARLDIKEIRACTQTPVNWKKIILRNNEKSLRKRITELDEMLKEKEKQIAQLFFRRRPSGKVIFPLTCSLDNPEEELSVQENSLFDDPFMDLTSHEGAIFCLTILNFDQHNEYSGKGGP